MKILFMGTPDFAVPCLEEMIRAGHTITGVVTQPDKPAGRGGKLSMPPVKECALRYHIPVWQPKKVKDPAFLEEFYGIPAQVVVVVAFGQILPPEILSHPAYGCINVHASLLPRWRGAAPIQWSILAGDSYTGVTTMHMDAGLDTGDIIEKKQVEITPEETGGSLHDKLSREGALLLLHTLELVERGEAPSIPQEGESTYASMLKKEMGHLQFQETAAALERKVRGLSPWPGTFAYLDGKLLKIWKVREKEKSSMKGKAPGSILAASEGAIEVATGKGSLELLEVQLEGKKRMDAESFLRGAAIAPGMILQ